MFDEHKKELLARMRGWCARQERCSSDVLQRFQRDGASKDDAEELLLQLATEGFVDDLRYTESFVSGHFRIKHWGRMKIRQALRQKGISDGMVDRAIQKEIDPVTYRATLEKLLERKLPVAGSPSAEGEHYKAKAKIMAWAYRKGFEGDLVARVLDELWSMQ